MFFIDFFQLFFNKVKVFIFWIIWTIYIQEYSYFSYCDAWNINMEEKGITMELPKGSYEAYIMLFNFQYILWNPIITILCNYVIMSLCQCHLKQINKHNYNYIFALTNHMSYSWVNNSYITDSSVLVTTYVFTLYVLCNSSFLAEFILLSLFPFCLFFLNIDLFVDNMGYK